MYEDAFHFPLLWPRQLMPPPLVPSTCNYLFPLASSEIIVQFFFLLFFTQSHQRLHQWPIPFSLTPSARQLAQAHRRRPDRSELNPDY